jgi:hypothetical protein
MVGMGWCAVQAAAVANTFFSKENSLYLQWADLKFPADRSEAMHTSGDATRANSAEGRMGKWLGTGHLCLYVFPRQS